MESLWRKPDLTPVSFEFARPMLTKWVRRIFAPVPEHQLQPREEIITGIADTCIERMGIEAAWVNHLRVYGIGYSRFMTHHATSPSYALLRNHVEEVRSIVGTRPRYKFGNASLLQAFRLEACPQRAWIMQKIYECAALCVVHPEQIMHREEQRARALPTITVEKFAEFLEADVDRNDAVFLNGSVRLLAVLETFEQNEQRSH